MSPRPNRTKRYLPAYVGLLILFLISATVRVRSTADQLDGLLHGTERARAPIDLRDPESTIVSDEEWGEDQLIACVKQCGELPANEIMQRIIVAADTFVAGHKQHDDMTIIVARLN